MWDLSVINKLNEEKKQELAPDSVGALILLLSHLVDSGEIAANAPVVVAVPYSRIASGQRKLKVEVGYDIEARTALVLAPEPAR